MNTTKSQYFRIYTFDWDDNIIKMPTKISIRNKDTKKEKFISTEEFAIHRNEIGKSGPYKNYEIELNNKSQEFSFRFFRDNATENFFLKDLISELKRKNINYKRSWPSLIKALSTKETARNTFIITARGHKPSTIFEAFKHLKKKKIIKNLPLLRNIFPVTHYFKECHDIGQTKFEFISKILNLYEKLDKKNNYDSFHHFSFSDDDANTIKTIADKIGREYLLGKWRKFQIYLHYTGESKILQTGTYVIGFSGNLVFQKNFVD